MFNEKSPAWIRIYKGITVAAFWLCIAASLILCFCCWGGEMEILDMDFAFLEGIILLVSGCAAAFVELVVNMLVIQMLNNIQLIREKLEQQ